MLIAENLECGYKQSATKAVVQGLSFSILPGEVMLLAGRNGIGKSTLLRTLAGLQEPLSGVVKINNIAISGLDAQQCADLVTVMFSTPPDLVLTSCRDVVLTGMQRNISVFQLNFEKEELIIKECLNRVGMLDFYMRDFASLSDGEKQKVMLARCLAQDTPVIILDEPLAFLDYPSRRNMLELLASLAKERNKTILYSSHDLDISLQHCNSLLMLETGGKWKLYTDKNEIENLNPAALF